MAYEIGGLDATLAMAAGSDAALHEELRAAFVESLERQLDLLRRARCDGNWRMAAMRLKGLGATFNAIDIAELADTALALAPGDPTVIRGLEDLLTGMRPLA